MKKMYLRILTVLTISSLASSQALATIYIQNNYGKQIQFVQEPAAIAHAFQEKTLGNGARVALNAPANVRDFINPTIPTHLSIRTVGGRYSDLSYLFRQIKSNPMFQQANAVIMINPSYGIYGWNIVIEWEKSGPVNMTESTIR